MQAVSPPPAAATAGGAADAGKLRPDAATSQRGGVASPGAPQLNGPPAAQNNGGAHTSDVMGLAHGRVTGSSQRSGGDGNSRAAPGLVSTSAPPPPRSAALRTGPVPSDTPAPLPSSAPVAEPSGTPAHATGGAGAVDPAACPALPPPPPRPPPPPPLRQSRGSPADTAVTPPPDPVEAAVVPTAEAPYYPHDTVTADGKPAKRVPFLVKLAAMVTDDRWKRWISWTPNGASIVINNPTEFSKHVLPKFFSHNNFRSFLRQLNLYDFYLSSDRRDERRVFTNAKFTRDTARDPLSVQRKARRVASRKALLTPAHADVVPDAVAGAGAGGGDAGAATAGGREPSPDDGSPVAAPAASRPPTLPDGQPGVRARIGAASNDTATTGGDHAELLRSVKAWKAALTTRLTLALHSHEALSTTTARLQTHVAELSQSVTTLRAQVAMLSGQPGPIPPLPLPAVAPRGSVKRGRGAGRRKVGAGTPSSTPTARTKRVRGGAGAGTRAVPPSKIVTSAGSGSAATSTPSSPVAASSEAGAAAVEGRRGVSAETPASFSPTVVARPTVVSPTRLMGLTPTAPLSPYLPSMVPWVHWDDQPAVPPIPRPAAGGAAGGSGGGAGGAGADTSDAGAGAGAGADAHAGAAAAGGVTAGPVSGVGPGARAGSDGDGDGDGAVDGAEDNGYGHDLYLCGLDADGMAWLNGLDEDTANDPDEAGPDQPPPQPPDPMASGVGTPVAAAGGQ